MSPILRIDHQAEARYESCHRGVPSIVEATHPSKQTEDQFIESIETHHEQAKLSTLFDSLTFEDTSHQLNGFHNQEDVLEKELDAESDNKSFEGFTHDVLEAAMVVLANLRLREEAWAQEYVNFSKNRLVRRFTVDVMLAFVEF